MQNRTQRRLSRKRFVYNPIQGDAGKPGNPVEHNIVPNVEASNYATKNPNQHPLMKWIDITMIAKLAVVSGMDKFVYSKGLNMKQLLEDAINLLISDNFVALKLYMVLMFLESQGIDVHKIARALSYLIIGIAAKIVMDKSYNWQEIAIRWIVAEYSVDTFLLQ